MRNLKKTPETIKKAKSLQHVIDYKWNKKIMSRFVDPLEGNENLDSILNKIGHKASVALTASLLEWIYWRFKGYSVMSDEILNRIEALWLSIESIENTKPLVFDTELNLPIDGYINGPIWTALMNVRMIDALYRKGSGLLQSELVGLVLLTQHITPKKKKFNKWFDSIIYKLADQFPNQNIQAEYSEDAVYDSSSEAIICRDFFFSPAFKYDEDDSENALHNFISKINYNTNSFCTSDKKFMNA